MHIYIDESGSFVRRSGQFSPSAVGALVVPDGTKTKLFDKYRRLRASLPSENGQIKGRQLDERQIVAVLDLARRSNCIFEASVIDANGHTVSQFEDHRRVAAKALVGGLTPEHQEGAVKFATGLSERLSGMVEQQYLQANATFMLLARTMESATTYYALRQPKELIAFHWLIDAKERDKTTDWEQWWSTTMLPWLQTHSINHPMKMLKGADYRFFERYQSTTPEYFPPETHGQSATDLKLLLTESFRFSSDVDFGLELVDVAVNCLRRALIGHIQQPAWDILRELLINRAGNAVQHMTIGVERSARFPKGSAVHYFQTGARSMLPPSYRRS